MKFLDVPQSGSIAGTVHSHNRAGQYTRNRRMPVQPIGTGRRAFIRASFGAASQAWSALSTTVQNAWISFANSYPITDSLGQSIKLTGHQMFVSCGTSLQNVGEALPTSPPSDNTVPDVSAVTVTFSVATGVSIDGFTGASTDFVNFAFSAPMSAGRRFNKTFWQPFGVNGWSAADGAPATLTTAIYAAQFGAPSIGQVVFVKVTPVNAGGYGGAASIVRVVVTT